MRERLAVLTRKCRHAARRLDALSSGMYLIGSTYNFCWPHQELHTTTNSYSSANSYSYPSANSYPSTKSNA